MIALEVINLHHDIFLYVYSLINACIFLIEKTIDRATLK